MLIRRMGSSSFFLQPCLYITMKQFPLTSVISSLFKECSSKCSKCQTWQHEQEVERSCLLLHPQSRVSDIAAGGEIYTFKVHPLCHTSSNNATNWEPHVQILILYDAWVVLPFLQKYKNKKYCSFSWDIMNYFPFHWLPVNHTNAGFRNCSSKRRVTYMPAMLWLALEIYQHTGND